MGLRTEKWTVAFRKKTDYRDMKTPFVKIGGSMDGWYADPFLFDYNGKTYIFAEFFSYKTVKGSIAFCEYNGDGTFGEWKEIISEPFHMSYPFIFESGDDVYLIPETSEADSLFLYKAIEFPYKWERIKTLIADTALVDTTVLPNNDGAVGYVLRNGAPEKTVLYSADGSVRDITSLRRLDLSRPGGKCFYDGGRLVFPTQDCSETYGGGLIFYTADDKISSFERIFSVGAVDIKVMNEKACIKGVHTYNFNSEFEVIDYKTETVSPVRILNRVMQKVGLK